jgi:hypothetical protein
MRRLGEELGRQRLAPRTDGAGGPVLVDRDDVVI